MQKENTAKTVLLTSVVTTGIVLAVLFLLRHDLVEYVALTLPEQTRVTDSLGQSHEDQIVSVIDQVNPAVVSVIITKDVPVYEQYYETFDPWGGFGSFSVPRVRENGTEEREVGGGSGFIVSNDGLIVTNRHVVTDEVARYSVLLNDGTSYQVEVIARDPQLDIAVLKIAEPLTAPVTFVRFGDSEALQLGETVIAIGNALAEFRNSVSVGVVSGLSRSIVASDSYGRSEQLDQVIQTDAAINPGNSGGPLLNLSGEVVGVNVATSQGAENIGFALPGQVVKRVVDSVQEHGRIVRPYLGIRYVMLTEEWAAARELPVSYGALITSGRYQNELAILPDSPADRAGLTDGVVILSIDGELLQGIDFATVLREKQVGDIVELVVWQAGEERTLSVTLEESSL